MQSKMKIGSRGSRLALWQAQKVAESLQAVCPALQFEIVTLKTLGDRQPELNLLENQGRGIFCSELEQALLQRQIDLAVHSVKDLPGDLPAGLVLGAYLEREDSREVLIGGNGRTLEQLPHRARVGTSSIRRLWQLKRLRPDLEFQPIRGNVETRIGKVADGRYDATILALAGVRRIGLEAYVTQVFELDAIIPAPGQGCIGVQVRAGDGELLPLLEQINHQPTALAVRAERALLSRLAGNCEAATGATARWVDGQLELRGLLGQNEHQLTIKTLRGSAEHPEALGVRLAEQLLGLPG